MDGWMQKGLTYVSLKFRCIKIIGGTGKDVRMRKRGSARLTASTFNFIFHTTNWQDCLLQHKNRVMFLANPVKVEFSQIAEREKAFVSYLGVHPL